jgi:hypothetical protein
MRAILDRGPLIALWRARDENKSWAERICFFHMSLKRRICVAVGNAIREVISE